MFPAAVPLDMQLHAVSLPKAPFWWQDPVCQPHSVGLLLFDISVYLMARKYTIYPLGDIANLNVVSALSTPLQVASIEAVPGAVVPAPVAYR